MNRRMKFIFKVGLTVVILVAIVLFYALNGRNTGKHRGGAKTENDAREDSPKQSEGEKLVEQPQSQKDDEKGDVGAATKNDLNPDDIASQDQRKIEPRAPEGNADVRKAAAGSIDKGKAKEDDPGSQNNKRLSTQTEDENRVHLAVVACGERLEETMVMLKSARVLSKAKLFFHIFAENHLHPLFKQQLEAWHPDARRSIKYSIYPITFPKGENAEEWKKLFKPCASQRLFLPHVLTTTDSVLYVDTDILFLRPIEDIWRFFNRFNSTQIAALAPEHEDPNTGWYNRFAQHPYYPPLGLNSGVMLMNLTRMREVKWLNYIIPYYQEYKLKITWGDQDLINIFFHFFPEKLFVYNCNWNYRPDHCMYMSVCKQAEDRGVSVVHGNRGVLHNDKQPTFKAIYQSIKSYNFGENLSTHLLETMRTNLKATEHTNCGRVSSIFTKQLARQIKLLDGQFPRAR